MSIIDICHETIKSFCLIIFSITHSFNHLNYIPFLIILIRNTKEINIKYHIFFACHFIIYEIFKFFSSFLTSKMNVFLGEHAYYSISICVLSLINLAFSIVSYSHSNIYIFICYRIFISLFNNISSYIDLPISLIYSIKFRSYKKRNFSFFQKISNIIVITSFLYFFNNVKKFYIFFFTLSVTNLICFIVSLIILSCKGEEVYDRYYPAYSEKEDSNKNSKVSQKKYKELDKDNNNISKQNGNESNNMDNSNNNNLSTNVNYSNYKNKNGNLNNLNKENIIDNFSIVRKDSINNRIKFIDKNNSQTIRGFIFPFLFTDNNIINKDLYSKYSKFIIFILVLFTSAKLINFISLFLIIFKVNKINIISTIDQKDELLFANFSSFLHLTSIEQEYLFLFICYYALNIIFYFINISYTSLALKRNFINYLFYYLSLLIFLTSNIFFVYFYLQKTDNFSLEIKKIRRNIICYFVFNFLLNECITIMSTFYNIRGKKKGFGEKLLKDIKAFSIFLAAGIFVMVEVAIAFLKSNSGKKFENSFYYCIFSSLILIMFIISLIIF